MEASLIIIAIIVTSLVLIAFAKVGGHAAKVKLAIRQGKRVDVAEVPDGTDVRIDGRVSYLAEPLSSPISGRTCAGYYVVVKEHRGKAGWVPLVREQRQRDFTVEDRTGRAIVQVKGAKIAVHQDEHTETGYLDEPTAEARKLLFRHGQKAEGFIFSRKLRYEEGVIEEGELVAVRGRAVWEPDPNPDPEAFSSYRGQPKRLVMTKPAEGDLFISDDPELFKPTT